MLLYEYPPKSDRLSKQLKSFNASAEMKKTRKNAALNVATGIGIVILGFIIPTLWVKAIVFAAAAFSFFTAYMLFTASSKVNDGNSYTKIYDDHIEHSQSSTVGNKVYHFSVRFSDIESSSQNSTGGLVLKLKDGHTSNISVKRKSIKKSLVTKNNCITLYFINLTPKMYLIDKMSDEIKYPKKNYLVIGDDDEDDKSW